MLERRKKEMTLRLEIEAEKVRLLERAYELENPFLLAFYTQCIESTAADAHEVFLKHRWLSIISEKIWTGWMKGDCSGFTVWRPSIIPSASSAAGKRIWIGMK